VIGMNLEAHLHESERKLAHIWKAMALRGAVGIAFSITQIIWAFKLRRAVGELERPFRRQATAKHAAHG
jgi:hypothetical protein